MEVYDCWASSSVCICGGVDVGEDHETWPQPQGWAAQKKVWWLPAARATCLAGVSERQLTTSDPKITGHRSSSVSSHTRFATAEAHNTKSIPVQHPTSITTCTITETITNEILIPAIYLQKLNNTQPRFSESRSTMMSWWPQNQDQKEHM